MLAGDGLHPSSKGARVAFTGSRPQGHRRPVRRDQGAARRLLGVAGEVARRGGRVGQARPEPRRRGRHRRDPPGVRGRRLRRRADARAARAGAAPARSRPRRAGSAARCAATDVNRTIDAVWRIESARLIAGLARMVRDVGVAEDLAQEALVAALEQWPESGVPDNPGAWLMATAQAPRDRPPAPRRRARAQDAASSAREIERRGEPSARPRGRDRRPVRRRPPAPDLHHLPPGAVHGRTGRAHAAAARRAHDDGDRPRLPGLRGDRRAAHRARQAHARRRRACRSRCPSAGRARRPPRVRARGDLPDLQRGLRGDRRRATGSGRSWSRRRCGSAASSPSCCPPSRRCTASSR